MQSHEGGIDPSIFGDAAKARTTIKALFKANAHRNLTAADALATSLLPRNGGAAQRDCTQAILVAYALEAACQGDPQRACAVLACWRGESPSQSARFDAFAAARRLAKSDLGFDALLAITEPSSASHSDSNATISREAKRQAILQADTLITRIQENGRKHGTAFTDDRAIELANSLVESIERAARSPTLVEPPLAEDLLIIARGLACARRLAKEPDADPPVSWRSAYFAARCVGGSPDEGSDLIRVQDSLATFVDYARHASDEAPQGAGRFGDWLKRVFFSDRRSPLISLREAASFADCLPELSAYDPSPAIEAVVNHLQQSLVPDGQKDRTPAVTARRAIRAAALRYWQTRISSSGQNVVLNLDATARNDIARDAEAILGHSPAREYVQRSTRLSSLDSIGPAQLRAWAAEENVPGHSGALITQSQMMEWTRRMAHPREARVRASEAGPRHARSVVEGLGRVAANLPEGTTAAFGDGSVHGPTTYVKLTGRIPLPFLHHHLPPELWPVGAVSGEVLAEKSRHALIELSRVDAHEATLSIVTSSSDSAAVGGGAFVQLEPTHSETYVAGQLDIVPSWRRRRAFVFHMTDTGRSTDDNVRLVIEALASASSVNGPTNAGAVLDSVAWTLYKEPGISAGWVEDDAMGIGGEARVNATVRAIPLASAAPVLRAMGGLMSEVKVSAGIERFNKNERGAASTASDDGIQTQANVVTSRTPVAAAPSIALPRAFPVIGASVKSLSLSSARLSSHEPFDRLASERTWAAAKGSTRTRIVASGQQIDMRRSVREAEATDIDALLRAIEALRTPDGRDGIPSREELKAKLSGQAIGDGTYVCRQRLAPSVAKQMNALRALSATLAGSGSTMPDSIRAQLLKSAEDQMQALQKRNDSWVFDGAYARSAPQTWGESVGPRWLFRAQTQTFFSLKDEHKIAGSHP